MSAMRSMVSVMCGLAAGTALAMTAQAAMAASNVSARRVWPAPASAASCGVESPGSGWGDPPTAAVSTLYDGGSLAREPAVNIGSVWWDANGPGGDPVTITLDLKHSYSLSQFIVQADNNDEYLLQYLSGGTWHTAFDVPEVIPGYGLTTRNSGPLAPITTTPEDSRS